MLLGKDQHHQPGAPCCRIASRRLNEEANCRVPVKRKLARATWGERSITALQNLKQLTAEHSLSVAAGELQFLDGKWYVTHAGLLGIARRNRCSGIKSALVERYLTLRWAAGCSRPPFIRRLDLAASLVWRRRPSNVSSWSAAPRCAVAKRGRSIGLSESLRHRALLRRRVGFAFRPANLVCRFGPVSPVSRRGFFNQWSSASFAGSTLPSDPSAQSRSHSREGLRRRLLRHANTQGSQPRSGRILHLPPRQGCEGRSRRLGLQTQFLCSTRGGEAMKRHVPGLHAEIRITRVSCKDCSSSASMAPPTAGIRRNPSSRSASWFWSLRAFATRSFSGRLYCHRTRAVETELVPAGFWL